MCYTMYKPINEKRNYDKSHPKLPERKCIWCDTIYSPRQYSQECCTRKCRNKTSLYNLRKYNKLKINSPLVDERKLWKKSGKWWVHGFSSHNKGIRVVETSQGLCISNSDYQQEIKKYRKSGGKVKVLEPQINGKVVDVLVKNSLTENWNIDDLMGFGYSNKFMEEVDRQHNHGGFDVD